MRGKKQGHSRSVYRIKSRVKRNLGNEVRRVPPRRAPDRKTPCIDYVQRTCTIYKGKNLLKMCPEGLGYLRDKYQNPNNWSECDGWSPAEDYTEQRDS